MGTILNGLSVSAKIEEGHLEALKDLLKGIQEEGPARNSVYSFGELPYTHFATLSILEEDTAGDGSTLPHRLVIMTSFSGSKNNHIRELAGHNPEGLDRIFRHLEGYDPEGDTRRNVYRYLRKNKVPNTVYTAYQYAHPETVAKENFLRESIATYLDNNETDLINKKPNEVREAIQHFVQNQKDLQWAVRPFRKGFWNHLKLLGPLYLLVAILGGSLIGTIWYLFDQNIYALTGLVIFCVFFGVLILLVLWLRINERRPFEQVPEAGDEKIYQITTHEQNPVTNEMTVATPLKKGLIRIIFLGVALRLVWFIRSLTYIPTVHTARWLQVDGGKRVVFIAYFDNTSEAYAHDFVDSSKRVRNLNLIFGSGKGFPKTKWAVIGGGKDRNQYIRAVRAKQQTTHVWYATHEHLSITNITNNRAIRKGLWGKMDDRQIQNWLSKL